MDKPHQLQRLLECLRRILRHDAAVLRDGQQLPPPCIVRAGGCLPLRLLRHTVGVGDQPLTLDNAGLPKIDLLLIHLALRCQCGYVRPALVHIAPQAHPQQLLMVAGRLAGHAVGQTHRDNVVIHARHCVGRQRRPRYVLHRLPLPIGERPADQLPILLGDVVGVFGPGRKLVQLCQIELRAGLKFRVQVRAPVSVRRRPHDQLVLKDQRGHVLHDVFDHLRSENGDGVARIFLVGLRLQNQPLGCDAGAGRHKSVSHTLDTLVQSNYLLPQGEIPHIFIQAAPSGAF